MKIWYIGYRTSKIRIINVNELKVSCAGNINSGKLNEEIECLKSRLEKATEEIKKKEKTIKDVRRDIKNKETQIKETSEKLKSLTAEKLTDKRHIEDLRKYIADLESTKRDILNRNANSGEIIDALQIRLNELENCQRENSSITYVYAGMTKKNSKPTQNRLSAENKTTVIESDVCNDIKKMVKKLTDEVDNVRKSQTSMEYRLSDVENIKMSDRYIKNPDRGDNSGYRQNDRSRTLRKCNQFVQTGNCKYGEQCNW